MSTAYVDGGRTRQKQRTRELLVRAATQLIENGDTPRVEDAAAAAGISRTTAYRYFPSQAELLAAAFPETSTTSVLPSPPPPDPHDRAMAAVTAIVALIERTEHQQRAMLRLSLGEAVHELPLRQGRAIGWLTEALEPLQARLGKAGVHDLALALRSVCGIETRVWLRDIAGLDDAGIRALQCWMADALLVRAEGDPPPRSRRRPARGRVAAAGPAPVGQTVGP